MNRSDLQKLADVRLKEAKTLLDAGCYEGAYYLAGYAIECALKACIAKKTREHDFPDQRLVNESYKHDLVALQKTAGLEPEFLSEVKPNKREGNKSLENNWRVVAKWSETSRYDNPIAKNDAQDLYSAIIDGTNGVLQWLKKRW